MNNEERYISDELLLESERIKLEQKRLDVENQRLSLELDRASRKNFLSENLTLIVTAIVPVVALIVSGAQVWVAYIQQDSDYKITAADVVFKHQEQVFSQDLEEQDHIISIIELTFPDELVDTLRVRLSELTREVPTPSSTATPSPTPTFSSTPTPSSTPTLTPIGNGFHVSYTSIRGVDIDHHNKITNYLREQDFDVRRADQREDQPSWFASVATVLYYVEDNREKAAEIARDLEKLTGREFHVAQGAGRGVSESERSRYFIIHYPTES